MKTVRGRQIAGDDFSYDKRHMIVYFVVLVTLMLPLSALLQPLEAGEDTFVSQISAREKALFAANVGSAVEVVRTEAPEVLTDNVNINLMIFFMYGVVLATYVYFVHKNQRKK